MYIYIYIYIHTYNSGNLEVWKWKSHVIPVDIQKVKFRNNEKMSVTS